MDLKELVHKLAVKYGTRDPFRIAKEMGFILIFAPLIEMRGFQQSIKRRRFIYINSELDEQQRSLVCAHELAHHLLHRDLNRMFMDRCTHMVSGKYENEANQFAVQLIYIDEELQPFLNRSITDAAAYMGVSLELARYRMSSVQPTDDIWFSEC